MRKNLKRLSSVLLLGALIATASAKGKHNPKNGLKVKSPQKYSKGDQAYKKRKEDKYALLALKTYREYYKKNPKDAEASWRVAMGCYFIGLRVEKDEDKKEKLFAEGRDIGLKGIALNPNCAPCHFWTAINMALYGDSVGPFKMLFSLATIEEHINKSIKIDPKFAYSGGYRLLGLIEQKLPGILGGDNDEAKDWFQKAIDTSPNGPLNYLFMARLLEEEFDERNKAVAMAERGLKVRKPAADELESIEAIEELKEFLKKHPKEED